MASIQNYKILRLLGKGGFGETFLVSDLTQGEIRRVLKRVPKKKGPKDSVWERIEILRREFAILSHLSHPNIARVIEFGEDLKTYFFLEEYVEGADIFQATQGVNYNQVFAALAQILRALNYLHRQGLIHGDLKAENILVVKDSSLQNADAIKLIDFGLAKHREEIATSALPSGTLHFMAPELLLERPYDHRADLFGLGVCLYRMLTGHYPFEQESGDLRRLIQAQIETVPVEPRCFRTDLPKGLNHLTMKLLKKTPEERFQSAAAALEALNEFEEENFALWTPAELELSLHEGSFIGRGEEIKKLKTLYQEGQRRFVLSGSAGIGKSRLEKEFRYQLQLGGEDDSQVFFQESEDEKTPEGSLSLLPWSFDEAESFLKNRLRIPSIPEGWRAPVMGLTQGIPQKMIQLAEFWLSEGIVKIDQDHCWFSQPRPKGSIQFETILKKKFLKLEKDKKGLLQLCLFAGQPLSKDLLKRVSGFPPAHLDSILESLEKELRIRRILYNGTYQYRVEGTSLQKFLSPLVEGNSFDSLLHLIEETYRSGGYLRARHHLETLLPRFEGEGDQLSRDQKAEFYRISSLIFLETGDLSRARSFCEKYLELPRLDPSEMGKILNRLGWIEYREGNYSKALEIFHRSLSHWDQAGDDSGRASAENILGITYQALRDWEKACHFFRLALSHLNPGDSWRPIFRMNLATCLQEKEEFEEAIHEYETARQESEKGTDLHLQARILNNLGNLYLYLGRQGPASRCAHDSLKISLENGLTNLEGQNYLLLSLIAEKENNLSEFHEMIEKAVSLFEAQGTASEKARSRLLKAYYLWTAGDDSKARELISKIRQAYPEEKQIIAQCDLLAGKIAAKREPSDLASGEKVLKSALTFFEGKGDQANLWDILFTLGRLYRSENPREALRYYERALGILDDLAKKIPEKDRESFFRDRKREKISAELRGVESLAKTLPDSSKSTEEIDMSHNAFTEVARITRMLASGDNLNHLLDRILEESMDLLQAERGFILLLEDGDFKIKALKNMDPKIFEGSEERYSTTISRQAATQGQSILVKNAASDERFKEASSVMVLKLRGVLAVPMKIGTEVVGVIYLDNRFREGSFDEAHQKLLEVFTDQAALAIRNTRQVEEIRAHQKKLESSKEQIEELNALLRERLDKTEMEKNEIEEKYRAQQEELCLHYSYDQIIGKSQKLKEVLKTLDRVTDSDVTVLITGESGTGKELIARALHYNSLRKEAPFVAENCSAFPANLLESELFGHLKGSFTGATANKKGIFEVAEGGTIFLDELGEMPLELQPKLLRVLQERKIRPIGANDYKKVNVRLVAATNRNLEERVKANKFREDLFYRLNVVRVTVPSLRERREDIPLLVEHFLKKNREETKQKVEISPKAMDLLVRYDWPGNIRELANEIQKCCALGAKVITRELLSDNILRRPPPSKRLGSLDHQMKDTEKILIMETLKGCKNSKSKAAEILGISRITLYKKMRLHGIKLQGVEEV